MESTGRRLLAVRTSRVPVRGIGGPPGGPALAPLLSSCPAYCATGRSKDVSRPVRCVTLGTRPRDADVIRTRLGTPETDIIRSRMISGIRGIRKKDYSTLSRRNSNWKRYNNSDTNTRSAVSRVGTDTKLLFYAQRLSERRGSKMKIALSTRVAFKSRNDNRE